MAKQKNQYRKYDNLLHELDFRFSYNDDETSKLHKLLNGSTSISEDDLRRVSLWKLDRILSVTKETLDKLNELSKIKELDLKDDIVKDVLEMLVLSQGIGFPMASAILKFINPNIFPIIDVRAYRALTGIKPYYGTYSYEKYIEYADELTKIAKLKNRPLREIDEQLYCFDKEYNGAI